MKNYDAPTLIKPLNVEGRIPSGLDAACAGFADWLSEIWGYLDDDEIALVTSVGAAL